MYRCIILFLLLSPIFVSAQTATDSITYSIALEDFVVTAQYEPVHYKKAMHPIDIIKKETIEKIGAVTLDQILRTSPSIRIYNDPVLGTSIRMRGVSASNVAILIDGVPMIGRNNGAIDLSQVSLHNIERIEIVEGPMSNIYGSDAAAGVINIITKSSQVTTWSINQSNQIESIGQRNHTASLGYQKRKFNLGINGRYFNYAQYPSDSLRLLDQIMHDDGSTRPVTRYPFNPKTQQSLGGYARYNISDDNYLLAKYQYNDESVTDYGVIKRPQFRPYANDQFYSTKRSDLSLTYKGKVKEHYFINALVSQNSYDRIRDDKRFYIETMTFDSLLRSSDSIAFDQIFSRADLHYTGYDNWVLGGGINLKKESGKGDRLINREENDSLVTSFIEAAIFSDIKYTGVDKLDLAVGNRWIVHNIYGNALTSSFQLKYNFSDKLTLRSSYAQGYRNPTLKELYLEFIDINHNIVGNVGLQPERSHDIQNTVSYSAGDNIELSFNGYYTSMSQRISLAEYEALKFRYENIDEYSVFGFQPSVTLSHRNLSINSGLSLGYWSTNIDRNDAPNYGRLLDLNTTLDYTWTSTGLSFLLNHRYTGAQPTYQLQDDHIEIGSIEDYHLLDISVSKSFWKEKINLTVGAKNLTNTTAVNVLNGNGGTHSSGGRNSVSVGRSWFATVGFGL